MVELPARLPTHVAVIMDGNGRWARARNLPRTEGHLAGAESAREIAKCCVEWGIPHLTLYAFSTENWGRPAQEVRFLMNQLRRFLARWRKELVQNGIRLRPIGRTGELPAPVRKELSKTEEMTRGASKLTLQLAVNYGSRSEVVDACRALAARVRDGRLAPEEIDERLLGEHLYTAGVPDPDLLIRTAGEMRLSNFLLWQASYAEIYVTEVLWPEFRRAEFLAALREFARRERRFGRTGQAAPGESPRRSLRADGTKG